MSVVDQHVEKIVTYHVTRRNTVEDIWTVLCRNLRMTTVYNFKINTNLTQKRWKALIQSFQMYTYHIYDLITSLTTITVESK